MDVVKLPEVDVLEKRENKSSSNLGGYSSVGDKLPGFENENRKPERDFPKGESIFDMFTNWLINTIWGLNEDEMPKESPKDNNYKRPKNQSDTTVYMDNRKNFPVVNNRGDTIELMPNAHYRKISWKNKKISPDDPDTVNVPSK